MRYICLFIPLFFLNSCYRNEEILTEPIGSINYTTTTNEFYTRYSYYYYNQDEQLIRIIHKNNGKEIGETSFKYDSNGKLIEKIEDIAWRYVYVYEYDNEGRLIFQKGTQPHKIIYDSLGRISTKQYYGGTLTHINYEIIYEYDTVNLNKIIKEIFNEHYSVYYRLIYHYNDKNQLYEKYLVEGASYLAPGPWEQFEYNANGELSREIKYARNITDFVGVELDIKYFYY